MVQNLPTSAGDVRDTGLSLGREDPPEMGMATHSSILAWRIPWTEELGGHSPCTAYYPVLSLVGRRTLPTPLCKCWVPWVWSFLVSLPTDDRVCCPSCDHHPHGTNFQVSLLKGILKIIHCRSSNRSFYSKAFY